MTIKRQLEDKRRLFGIHEYAFAKTSDLLFSMGTRLLCEGNQCGHYGATWACPPAVGSYNSCVAKCRSYENVCLLSTVTDLKGQYDFRGWNRARIFHEAATAKSARLFRAHYPGALVLSTEGCILCDQCTYPDAPCRYPDQIFPSVEGYGIVVMDLASKTGLSYNNGPETVTYFSFVLF
ncbi:DUF2284 domain-containing protein [Eubacterium sp. AM05-23]|nr:DUF2284 domain-containing protein [Eubacterium sp. AM05-23]